jgi:3-oxoadipate enol-lactonase
MNTFHTPPMGDVLKALTGERIAHADLDALGIPILMITGTDDDLFPAPLIIGSATMLRNATLVEIAGAGHSAYFERPDEYNAALLKHLERR